MTFNLLTRKSKGIIYRPWPTKTPTEKNRVRFTKTSRATTLKWPFWYDFITVGCSITAIKQAVTEGVSERWFLPQHVDTQQTQQGRVDEHSHTQAEDLVQHLGNHCTAWPHGLTLTLLFNVVYYSLMQKKNTQQQNICSVYSTFKCDCFL